MDRKNVILLSGAGQIGMAIARRMGYGMKIIIGDIKIENAETISKIMKDAGYDAEAAEMDLSDRNSIKSFIAKGQNYGDIKMLVNAAGVSPSQASVQTILKVDLYGTAVLLEEVGKVIQSQANQASVCHSSLHRKTPCSPAPPQKSCCRLNFCSPKT